VPTILGHLSVMLQLLGLRLFGARRLRASLRSRSDAAGVEAR
jgi:hypothetical protein